MAKDCLLLPESNAGRDTLNRMVDTALAAGPEHPLWSYFQFVKGLAEYRQGRFSTAAEWVAKVILDRRDPKRTVGANMVLNQQRLDIDELEIAAPTPDDELLAISDALERFSTFDEPKAKLVKLRYFAGLTIEEAAPILGISRTTAKRWWTYARAWLYQQVHASPIYIAQGESDFTLRPGQKLAATMEKFLDHFRRTQIR
jgi:RNA polymerase sigma factor (sigma-70 family)